MTAVHADIGRDFVRQVLKFSFKAVDEGIFTGNKGSAGCPEVFGRLLHWLSKVVLYHVEVVGGSNSKSNDLVAAFLVACANEERHGDSLRSVD